MAGASLQDWKRKTGFLGALGMLGKSFLDAGLGLALALAPAPVLVVAQGLGSSCPASWGSSGHGTGRYCLPVSRTALDQKAEFGVATRLNNW